MKNNNQTCCLIGPRQINDGEVLRLQTRLDEEIGRAAEQGVLYFVSGAMPGFQTLAALAVLKQQRKNPAIHLVLVLPMEGVFRPANALDAIIFAFIKDRASHIVHSRNCPRYQLVCSGFCIYYLPPEYRFSSANLLLAQARQKGLVCLPCM